ncbi:hypothetical protein JO84_gp035 [Aureococcus anophagefferens virus]|uniref:Uncharacterized protein n=1 Tax=Aureococcus anophagefferens virus TaxID=1474867 RepID=A0A076FH64_9VIRU|nr:hypothetical protein JO84_gp035 [Aureococcus anophagefferens virus]AII17092.1 hypothetical protein AaV_035 [Aureococcus anophagefferens virus]UOG94337.1 hypothetical protein MKD35_302 [Aureococcus anophagefferens virus]
MKPSIKQKFVIDSETGDRIPVWDLEKPGETTVAYRLSYCKMFDKPAYKLELDKGHYLIVSPVHSVATILFSVKTIDSSGIDISMFGETVYSCYKFIQKMIDCGKMTMIEEYGAVGINAVDDRIFYFLERNYVSISMEKYNRIKIYKNLLKDVRDRLREQEAKENRFSYRLMRLFSFSKSKH